MNYTYYRRYRPSKRRSGFKSFFWLVLGLVLCLLLLRACVSVLGSMSEDKKDEAVLSVYKGTAEILEWGQTEAESASDTELLLQGDQVSTGPDSVVTLTFYNGTVVYVDENSKVQVADFTDDGVQEQMTLDLVDGRVWVHHEIQDEEEFQLLIHTDVMNIASLQGDYLVSNQPDKEYVAVQKDKVNVDFVDRGTEDIVIETGFIEKDQMSFMDDAKERALINRENVTLVEAVPADFWLDAFVLVATGQSSAPTVETPVEETSEEITPVVEEPVVEEPEVEVVIPSGLIISVSSPTSGSTITKDAIAIEGQIVSGTASSVTVTWSGNGQAYTLAGFQAGGSSFRYVADVEYKNYAAGSNTYTIVAYDAEGKASNTVTLVITGQF